MSGNTIIRLLDSFMRRWWLYLVPVLLLGAFGAKTVSSTKDTFVSGGTVSVSSATLVEKLSQSNNTPNYGYDTPAGATTKQLAAQLQTDQFLNVIIARAGLTDEIKSGAMTLRQVRSAIGVAATSTNLFRVTATLTDPALTPVLAQATIDAFNQSVLDANLADSAGAIKYFDGLATTYAADVETTRAKLAEYLAAHEGPKNTSELRPEDQQVIISQLTDDVTQAVARYQGAVSKREEAKLTSEQTKSEVGSRLVLVDKPELPTSRQPKLKRMVLTFAMFLILGTVIAVAAITLSTALDQGVRVLPELRDRLGNRALAAIPDAGRIPVVTGTVAEIPRRAAAAPERPVRRGREPVVAPVAERGPRRGLDLVEQQPEAEPVQAHGPRRIGSRPSGTPGVGNTRRQGPIGHGRRSGSD
jgi:hypothetical protein